MVWRGWWTENRPLSPSFRPAAWPFSQGLKHVLVWNEQHGSEEVAKWASSQWLYWQDFHTPFTLSPSSPSQFTILSGSGNIEGIQIFFPLGLRCSHLNDRCLNMLTLPIHSTALGCNSSCVSYDLNKGWNTFINKIDSVMGRFNVNVQMKS